MAVQDYELLLRVRADLLEALNGLKGLTNQLGQGDAAAKQLGDSAAAAGGQLDALNAKAGAAAASTQAMGAADTAAAARIDALAIALRARDNAASEAFAKTAQAARASAVTVKNADAEAAAFRRTQAAALAYREAEAARGGAPAAMAERTAALEAQRVAMGKLASQIDPAISALARLDVQEASLNEMRKAGVVGMEDYTRFKTIIDKNRVSLKGASHAMHSFSLNSSNARREIGRLGSDIARGNWGRFDQSALTLANYTGLMSVVFSPLGLAIAAVTGSIAAFALAANGAANDENAFNHAIQLTGNYAGVTSGELEVMAEHLTSASITTGQARTVLDTLVASGKVGSGSLKALGQAAVDMAALTGESADKAAASVLKMFDGTAAGALKADEQYHFLTTDIYDQIKAYEEEGNTQAAIDTAADAFHKAAQERIASETKSVRGLAAAWASTKSWMSRYWEALKTQASISYGTANDQVRLKAMEQRKSDSQYFVAGTESGAYGPGPWSDADEAKLQALRTKIAADKKAADELGIKQSQNSAAVKADASLDKLSASVDKLDAKKQKIKQLTADFEALWAGADPNNAKLKGVQRVVGADGSISFAGGMYDQLLRDLNKRYDPKQKHGRSQASIDTAAAAAQQQLVQMLAEVQGRLNPTAAAWAAYNKAVDEANKVAAKAVTGSHANVQAIHAERDAYIAVAAQVREAALAKEADKDRQAYERLRDSIKDVNNVSLAKAFAQLQLLNDQLKRGTITQAEHDSTSSALVDSNLKKQPSYQGLDAVVGGPFGEVQKADAALQKEKDWYQQSLDALNQFHDKKLLSDAEFAAKEQKLTQEHAKQVALIDADKNKAMMIGITDSLQQGAQAIKQGFGAQSEAYRVAFDLAKAAAVAMATVNMFAAISKATGPDAPPWPANLPLIAQATSYGLEIIGDIRAITTGFMQGGYTGPGGKYVPAGIVHKGEVVFSQDDIKMIGGVQVVEAFRKGKLGYANGGVVSEPYVPSLAGFEFPAVEPLPALPAAGAAGAGAQRSLRIVNVTDPKLVHEAMSSSEGEQVILNTISRNRATIKQAIK